MPLLRATIKLPTLPERLVEIIADKVTLLMLKLQQHIVGQKLSGQVLKPRSGKLLESVQPDETRVSGAVIMGSVRAGGDQAFYAPFHEHGGSRPYDIYPLSKQALFFNWQGKDWLVRHVVRKPLPARPYMSTSLEEMKEEIVTGIRQAVMEALQ